MERYLNLHTSLRTRGSSYLQTIQDARTVYRNVEIHIHTVPLRHRPGSTLLHLAHPSLTTKPRQFSRYTKLQLSLGLVYTRQHDNHIQPQS